MRLIIPAALAAILASPAAQAQAKLCLAPERANSAYYRQLEEDRAARVTRRLDPVDFWSRAAETECKAGEIVMIYDPAPAPGQASWPTRALIARHCDLTKQVVVLPNAAICYVIQPPRQ
jgi:hypothetical protein